MEKYILAIDQGTTSSRALIFDKKGNTVASFQQEFRQIFPKPGWVEHDPYDIWNSVVNVISGVLIKAKITLKQISAIGIANQRETTLVWNKETGKPIYNAIVWQSRQSEKISNNLIKKGHQENVHKKTGLIINPYFSATKIAWILDNVEGARDLANDGKLLFGTIDTWLIYKLTHGSVHATDYSNASRTMLFNINELKWDEELLSLLNIPLSMMPSVKESSTFYGYVEELSPFGNIDKIPITGVIGDQQAALFGQTGFEKGDVKNTYGTGCFLLLNTGEKPTYSKKGLLTTIAWGIDGKIEYALEGSIFVGGSVIQWLRDELNLFKTSSASEAYASKVESSEGIYFVPAFVGLGTPYWDNEARGAIFGLTRGSNKAHLTRAALESIAYQTLDVIKLMQKEAKINLVSLAADGGATENNILMQFQSDILQKEVHLPQNIEITALGAAYLAGLAIGYYSSKEEIKSFHRIKTTFKPMMTKEKGKNLYRGWQNAVKATRTFKQIKGE